MKDDLIDAIAKEANFCKKDVEIILNSLINQMRITCRDMEEGDKFTLNRFLTFRAMKRIKTKARNPKTNEEYVLPPAKNIKVKVTRSFHDFVNGITSNGDDDDV